MCKELEIGRASYYKWLRRKPTLRDIENEELLKKIKEIDEKFNHLFGHRKMTIISTKNTIHITTRNASIDLCASTIYSQWLKSQRKIHISNQKLTMVEENKLNRDF